MTLQVNILISSPGVLFRLALTQIEAVFGSGWCWDLRVTTYSEFCGVMTL
jgi:hypothetical protein